MIDTMDAQPDAQTPIKPPRRPYVHWREKLKADVQADLDARLSDAEVAARNGLTPKQLENALVRHLVDRPRYKKGKKKKVERLILACDEKIGADSM